MVLAITSEPINETTILGLGIGFALIKEHVISAGPSLWPIISELESRSLLGCDKNNKIRIALVRQFDMHFAC